MTTSKVLPGGDQSALRHLNTSRVLQLLYEEGPLTVNGLSQVTGLSRPTVRGIVTALQEARLLRRAGEDAVATGGRPAQRYAFDTSAGFLAGVHIDVNRVSVRLADLGGTVLATAERRIEGELSAQERVQRSVALIREQLDGREGQLWALGVGTPGIVDSGGTVRLSVAIPHWSGVRLADELGQRLSCPVAVMKDANAAALAEHREGAARGVPDLLYVQLGERVGVGVLVDGVPFTGCSGAVGEIGRHPVLGWEQNPSRLAAVAAGSPRDSYEETAALLFARARHGDAEARAAVEDYARVLADGVGAMVLAVDPRGVVLGGSLARIGAAQLVEPMRARLEEIVYRVPPVTVTALSADAVAVGGVEVARDLVRDRMSTLLAAVLDG